MTSMFCKKKLLVTCITHQTTIKRGTLVNKLPCIWQFSLQWISCEGALGPRHPIHERWKLVYACQRCGCVYGNNIHRVLMPKTITPGRVTNRLQHRRFAAGARHAPARLQHTRRLFRSIFPILRCRCSSGDRRHPAGVCCRLVYKWHDPSKEDPNKLRRHKLSVEL